MSMQAIESGSATPRALLAYYLHSNYHAYDQTSEDHHSDMAYSRREANDDVLESISPPASQHANDPNSEPSQSFFFDLTGTYDQAGGSTSSYTYTTPATQVVGTTSNQLHQLPSTPRRCFNCGESTHSLAGCPEPRNEPLIRLSRQLFQAGKADDEDVGNSSLSGAINAEGELLRRKDLASRFFPGQVSSALREALFWDSNSESPDADCMDPERPMPWFVGMEKWGYPPGFAISENDKLDPFEAVTQRLTVLGQDHVWGTVKVLELHRGESPPLNSDDEGYDSDEEVLRLLVPKRRTPPVPLPPPHPVSIPAPDFPASNTLPPLPSSVSSRSQRMRIVKYVGAPFCIDHLPVYNGRMLRRKQACDCVTRRSPEKFKTLNLPSGFPARPLPARPTVSSGPSRRFSPYPSGHEGEHSRPKSSTRSSTRVKHRRTDDFGGSDRRPSKTYYESKSDPRTVVQRESCPAPSVTVDHRYKPNTRGSGARDSSDAQVSLPSRWTYNDLCYPSPPPTNTGYTADPPAPSHPRRLPAEETRPHSTVPMDENMAWYTALLSVYPSEQQPLPQQTSVLLSPESLDLSDEGEEQDMDLSDGEDA